MNYGKYQQNLLFGSLTGFLLMGLVFTGSAVAELSDKDKEGIGREVTTLYRSAKVDAGFGPWWPSRFPEYPLRRHAGFRC